MALFIHGAFLFAGWLLVAMLFETGWAMLNAAKLGLLDRTTALKLAYGVAGTAVFIIGAGDCLLRLLALAPVAISHLDLSRRSTQPIHLKDLIVNMGLLLKKAGHRIAASINGP